MTGMYEVQQGIATMTAPSMLNLVLMALFALICGSFVYTQKATSKIWDYLTNHLTEKVKELVRTELDKQ